MVPRLREQTGTSVACWATARGDAASRQAARAAVRALRDMGGSVRAVGFPGPRSNAIRGRQRTPVVAAPAHGVAATALGSRRSGPIIGSMEIKSDNPDHGFQFPGDFEITAMGPASAGLEVEVPNLLRAAGLTVLHETLASRPSSKDRKSTRLNSSHVKISYAVYCLKKQR